MLGGDIRIKWHSETAHGDFSLDDNGADISTDEGLETAVIISLFSDRRADEEELPPGAASKRGWWGDSLLSRGDRIGSKLWLLNREKFLPEVAARAKGYAEEALKWMLEDRAAAKVQVEAELQEPARLALRVRITRPNGREAEFRYNCNWNAQEVMNNAI